VSDGICLVTRIAYHLVTVGDRIVSGDVIRKYQQFNMQPPCLHAKLPYFLPPLYAMEYKAIAVFLQKAYCIRNACDI
jgi:hypothetical protein